MSLELVSTSSDLLTTQEAKDHLRITTSDEDSLIDEYIKAATKAAERYTNRAFLTTTYKQYLDSFPISDGGIFLLRPPLKSLTSIDYVDTDGNTQTLDSSKYQVDDAREPAIVFPTPDEEWPDTQEDKLQAVTIKYDAGYGDSDAVPDEIKHAVKILVGHFYDESRTGTVVGQATSMSIPWPKIVNILLSNYAIRSVY